MGKSYTLPTQLKKYSPRMGQRYNAGRREGPRSSSTDASSGKPRGKNGERDTFIPILPEEHVNHKR